MAVFNKHINKKTGLPFTTAQYAETILEIYKVAQEEHSKNPSQPFDSPLGGVKDHEVLKYCEAVIAIENPYEREKFAINALTNKSFLMNANIKKEHIN